MSLGTWQLFLCSVEDTQVEQIGVGAALHGTFDQFQAVAELPPPKNALHKALYEEIAGVGKMERIPRKVYTYEFKLEAVQLAGSRLRVLMAARSLGVVGHTAKQFSEPLQRLLPRLA